MGNSRDGGLNTTEAGRIDADKLAELVKAATPGPWAVARNKRTWGWVDVDGPSFKVGGPTQATDLRPRDEAIRLADAALIAMAPDLAAEVLQLRADLAANVAAKAALMVQLEAAREALDELYDAITASDRFGDRALTITGSTENLKWLLQAEDDARAWLDGGAL